MGYDAGYAITRRNKGTGQAVISRVTGEPTGGNPLTGDLTSTTTDVTVRRVYKEPTRYSRLFRAQATQQDVGDTTFVIWTKDVTFTSLDADDTIVFGGLTYKVKTSTIEDETAMVVTADDMGYA